MHNRIMVIGVAVFVIAVVVWSRANG